MNQREHGLKDGFTFAYKTFLQSIAEVNFEMIENVCENNLATVVSADLRELSQQGYKLKLCKPA